MALTKWERIQVTCDAGPAAIIDALQDVAQGAQLIALDTDEVRFLDPDEAAIRRVTLTFERSVS